MCTGLLGEFQLSNGFGSKASLEATGLAVAASPVIPRLHLSYEAFFKSCLEILFSNEFSII